jgi:hypothetical protein
MEQSTSWEACSHPAGQKIPHLLLNSKIRCCGHKRPAMDAVICRSECPHCYTLFSKIPFSIIFPSTPKSLKRCLLFSCATKFFYAFLIFPMHATRPPPPQFIRDLIIILSVSLLGPYIFRITRFSNAFSLCSSLRVRDKFHTQVKLCDNDWHFYCYGHKNAIEKLGTTASPPTCLDVYR